MLVFLVERCRLDMDLLLFSFLKFLSERRKKFDADE